MVSGILSAVAGYVAWTAIFLGGSAGVRAAFSSVHDEEGMTKDVAALSCYLVVSVIASLAGGFLTGKLAPVPYRRWVIVLGCLLLLTGIPVQLSAGDAIPVWYNVIFLFLLIPVALLGGRLAACKDA